MCVTYKPSVYLRSCMSICYAKINTMCGQGLFNMKFTWFRVLITIMFKSIILLQVLFSS
jgi:hypothetical protein